MKRHLLVALSVLVVLALSVPAFAAINWSGQYILENANYTMRKDQEGTFTIPESDLFRINFDAREGNARIRGQMQFNGLLRNDGQHNFDFNSAKWVYLWADVNGPWVDGGDSLTFSIGRFQNNWHNWGARFNYRDLAFRLTGVNVGPVNLSAYHGRQNDTTGDAVTALRGRTSLGEFALDTILTQVYKNNVTLSNNYVVQASGSPVEGLQLTGIYSGNTPVGGETKNGWRIDAALSTIPNLTLRGSLFHVDAGYSTSYWYQADRYERRGRAIGANNSGYYVEANTTQAGIDFGAVYMVVSLADKTNPRTAYELSADVSGTKITYFQGEDVFRTNKGKLGRSLAVERTVDIPLLRSTDLKWEALDSTVPLKDNPLDGNYEHTVSAGWTAPNDMKFNVSYNLTVGELKTRLDYTVNF